MIAQIVLARLLSVRLPDPPVPWSQIHLILGIFVAVVLVIKLVRLTDSLGYGAYSAILARHPRRLRRLPHRVGADARRTRNRPRRHEGRRRDWVGTPPEGFHSRDKADPDYWRSQCRRTRWARACSSRFIIARACSSP